MVGMLLGFLQLTFHIRHEELPRYPDRVEVQDNRDLRVKLALNEIERVDMKRKLQQREKRVLKLRDVNHILSMFTTTTDDLMRQCVVSPSEAVVQNTITTILELIKYCNAELGKLASRYSCVMPSIVTDNRTSTRWRIRIFYAHEARRGGPYTYLEDLRAAEQHRRGEEAHL